MINSLKSEIKYLFSGLGMPYEKVCLIVAIFVTVFFTIYLGNNVTRDVAVAVIDLDHSRYSQELVSKIDSSPYMRVSSVVYTTQEPKKWLMVRVTATRLPSRSPMEKWVVEVLSCFPG